MKAGTCARDRRALQQLALKEHIKHTDLTSGSGGECTGFFILACSLTCGT